MNSIKIGVVPVKRGGTRLDPALREKQLILKKINQIKQREIELVDIEDITENGIL